MNITGIAKSYQTYSQKTGKASSKLSDSLREKRAEYAGEDAWMDAAKEVNANGMGIRGSGMMSHIPQMMVIENKGPSLFLFLTKGRDISHLNGFCYSFNR